MATSTIWRNSALRFAPNPLLSSVFFAREGRVPWSGDRGVSAVESQSGHV